MISLSEAAHINLEENSVHFSKQKDTFEDSKEETDVATVGSESQTLLQVCFSLLSGIVFYALSYLLVW